MNFQRWFLFLSFFSQLSSAEPEIMSKSLQSQIYKGSDKELRAFIDRNRENIAARNYYWQTPLILVASNGKLDLAKTLVEIYKAKLDDTDRDGNSALIMAAQYGWADMVEYLLSKGADKSAINNQGETAADAAQNELATASGGPFTDVINMLKKSR